jgi:hypothetical protein
MPGLTYFKEVRRMPSETAKVFIVVVKEGPYVNQVSFKQFSEESGVIEYVATTSSNAKIEVKAIYSINEYGKTWSYSINYVHGKLKLEQIPESVEAIP